jgi:hypothetical protein
MNIKKKCICLFTSFESLNATYHTQKNLYKYVASQFDKFYIVNVDNLRFFSSPLDYQFSEEIQSRPKNILLVNLKDSIDFKKFISDKILVVINNFGKSFQDLKIHLLLKKKDIFQVQFKNIGNIQFDQIVSKKHFLLTVNYLILNRLSRKITTILSSLNIINKIDISFISNKQIYERAQKTKLKKFIFTKNFSLVNSKFQDEIDKSNLSEKYIVHLDYYLNYHSETVLRGNMDPNRVKMHHDCVQNFLTTAQKKLNKEVIISIHPQYPIEYFENFYKNFKIVKYKTAELIKDAGLVTFFDSSAIVNAVLMKKKIIQLTSKYMDKNEQYHSTIYKKKLGLSKIEIDNFNEDNFDEIYQKCNFNKDLLNNYLSNFHLFDNNEKGSVKIVKTIKKKYFSD